MSTADEWDLTVPDDDEELLAELRRHGVEPGRRLRMSVASSEAPSPPRGDDERKSRRLSFAEFVSAETDLSERTDDYLKGLGQGDPG